jgi:site-specific DNA recombinase
MSSLSASRLTAHPRGIRYVRGYAAAVERAKFSERSIRAKIAQAKAGRPLSGGRLPYGYRWKDERKWEFEADAQTAPWVQKIFAWASAGRTLRWIRKELNNRGVPTPRKPGGLWAHTTLYHILTNPTYAGRRIAFRYMGVKTANGKVVMRARPTEDQVPLEDGAVPAIVSGETFEAVQARLKLNKQLAARNNQHPEAALLRSGYVRCGHCGGTMTVHPVGPRGRYYHYRCVRGMATSHPCQGASMAAHHLDPEVWTRVERILTTPEIVAEELQRMYADDPTEADLKDVDRALAEITRQQHNLVNHLANLGKNVAAIVRERLEALDRERERLQAERATILASRTAWESAQGRLGELEAWCKTVAANLVEFGYEQKRLALEALGVSAKVWRAGHEPRYEITADIQFEAPIVDESRTVS